MQLFSSKTNGFLGIGAMMAKALDANGAAKVYILGRRLDKLQEVAKQGVTTPKFPILRHVTDMSKINGSVVPIPADVTSKSDLEAAATQVKVEVGFVNVVIANSGITGPTLGGLSKDRQVPIAELQEYLWKSSQEEFTETYNVNVSGMMYTAVAFLSLLDAGNTSDKSVTKAKGIKSQFIATGSVGAYNRIPAAGFAYGGSKAAVHHVIKQLSTHLAPYHIRANVIAPGIYPSELSAVSSLDSRSFFEDY